MPNDCHTYYMPNFHNFYMELYGNNTNPSIHAKHMDCNYFSLPSKFEMNVDFGKGLNDRKSQT